jgi:hypothetical protein
VKRGRFRESSRTPYDLRWPNAPEYTELARIWSEDAVTKMLTVVWRGYDSLVAEFLAHIDMTEVDEEIERSITQLLASTGPATAIWHCFCLTSRQKSNVAFGSESSS